MAAFNVKYDFSKAQPQWSNRMVAQFGAKNEGFLVDGHDAKSAIAAWNEAQRPGDRLNPFYLKITQINA